MSAAQDRAWNLFDGARQTYIAHPCARNAARVQMTFRAYCEAMNLHPRDIEDCMTTLNLANGWVPLPAEAAA